jgi:hypothetical protein
MSSYEKAQCSTQIGPLVGGLDNSRQDRTVGENLDAKIEMLEVELARLKASRASLTPLLSMKLRDIRSAMDY